MMMFKNFHAPVCVSSFNQPWDVRNREGMAAMCRLYRAQLGSKRCEGVVSHFGRGTRYGTQQGALSRIRQSHQTHISQQFQLKLKPNRLSCTFIILWLQIKSPIKHAAARYWGRAGTHPGRPCLHCLEAGTARRGTETCVAAAAFPSTCHDRPIALPQQIHRRKIPRLRPKVCMAVILSAPVEILDTAMSLLIRCQPAPSPFPGMWRSEVYRCPGARVRYKPPGGSHSVDAQLL